MPAARAGQRLLVLIVEDDGAIADLLAEVVRDLVDADTVSVPHPDRAPRDRRVDLVITDLIGEETHRVDAGRRYLARLRTLFAAVPILLLTGQPWAQETAEALPVDGVLTKPFDIDDLIARVRALLRGGRRSAA